MRTLLSTTASSGRHDLTSILVPLGKLPELPATAPPASTWKGDFGKEEGDHLLLRGARGQRWFLQRVARTPSTEALRCAAGRSRQEAETVERASLVIDLSLLPRDPEGVRAVAEGAGMAAYDPAVGKKERKRPCVKRITLIGAGSSRAARQACKEGALAAEANLAARELANLPANLLTPRDFARRARALCRRSPRLQCKVHGEKAMREMKMGALLGVSRGSAQEAQLVHMRYRPTRGKAKGRIAVVGKGLVFDTGGISLKPSAKMEDMKFDMCGAAAVYGLFHALAHGLELPWEVHGVMACVENMPGGNAQRPGDIVTAMNGKTIEVLNTDAEGRLVLADALVYTARKIKPDRIYDLATLTGAAIVALGHHASAILGNDEKLRDAVQEAGERCGERCWPLPLWEVHEEMIRGSYADLKNIYAPGQGAGTIAGAAFLAQFVAEIPWVHIDIAATAWEGPDKPYASRGGRGTGVRLLLTTLGA